jgi:hypothetical protein
VIVVAAVAVWLYVGKRRTPAPAAEPAAATASPQTEAPPAPLGGTPAPVAVPPLDQSDDVVRQLVRQLTSHPTVASWLATDGLIRNFTVSMANVADGVTPARHLRTVRPSAPFAVTTQNGRSVIDPASYRRYDSIAAAVASIDPQGAAQLYATLKPRIEEAYRDLGHPDTPVDRAVEQSIVRLLQTPVVEGPIEVRPASQGIGYVFADPNLEALSGAQKQLLRTGPDNVRKIQQGLRTMARALGIPDSRLPSERTTRAAS